MKINEEKIGKEILKNNYINSNEIILFDKNEIKGNNKIEKDLFSEIKSIHDYLDSKIKKDLNEIKNEELKSNKNNTNEKILKESLIYDNIYKISKRSRNNFSKKRY